MASRKTAMPKKLINVALQGGGTHGAYTWGVLDRLLAEDRIEIEAISGTSAGAVNAVVVAEGLVARQPIPQDRRAFAVRLTAKGKAAFDAMAAEHERWVIGMLADVAAPDRSHLYQMLGTLKRSVSQQEEGR